MNRDYVPEGRGRNTYLYVTSVLVVSESINKFVINWSAYTAVKINGVISQPCI
jgi:hypothetical protein